MAKLVYLSDVKNDGSLISPQDCLRDAIERCDGEGYNKCLVLLLDDRDGYQTAFNQSGMKCSEMLALLEVMKVRMLQHMGFIND